MAVQSSGTISHRDTVQDLTEAARLRHVLEVCLGDSSPHAIATCSLALRRLARLQLSKEAVRGLHLGRVAKQVVTEGPPTAARDAEALCDLWRAQLRSGPLNAFCQAEARLRLEPHASDIAILVDMEPLLGSSKLEQQHRLQAGMTLQAIALKPECEQSLRSLAESATETWSVELASSSGQSDFTVASKKANALPSAEALTAAATEMADADTDAAEADIDSEAETETTVFDASAAATKLEACSHGRAVILVMAIRAQALKDGEMSLSGHCSLQQSSTGGSNDGDWHRFYDEGRALHWWRHMRTGISFSEGDPAWQKYRDPTTGRRWWWHSFSGEWFLEPLLSDKEMVKEIERGDIAAQSSSAGDACGLTSMAAEVGVQDATKNMETSSLLSSGASPKRRWRRGV